MKAILVIDMPNECIECPCFYDYLYCKANMKADVLDDERPSNCPLKPMPQKKEIDWSDSFGKYNYKKGYNKCIDEILGGVKDE